MTNPRFLIITAGRRISGHAEVGNVLRASGYEVLPAHSAGELSDLIGSRENAAIALVDLKDPQLSGYEAMRLIREISAETQVIVLSAKHSTKEAVEAQSRGAFCYFSDPLDIEEFLFLVAKATIVFELATGNRDLKNALFSSADVRFNGTSPEARRILLQVDRVASLDTTILLTGETGTGKTTVARLIHNRSNRAQQPFISLSCASIPRDLLEAELFGFERGAFTGAAARKIGSLELANKGTLLLDEIGDLPIELQPKLLTFLQDRQLRRLGGTKVSQIDVRIIAATNRDLGSLVKAGTFREDLFFRINVVNIKLPPLRTRPDDLEALAKDFLARLAVRRNEKQCSLSKDAVTELRGYRWPGNVRELENILERASLFCGGNRITAADLRASKDISADTATVHQPDDERTLADIEKSAILTRLERFGGNKQRAAKSLGISLKTIYNKMRDFEIQ